MALYTELTLAVNTTVITASVCLNTVRSREGKLASRHCCISNRRTGSAKLRRAASLGIALLILNSVLIYKLNRRLFLSVYIYIIEFNLNIILNGKLNNNLTEEGRGVACNIIFTVIARTVNMHLAAADKGAALNSYIVSICLNSAVCA